MLNNARYPILNILPSPAANLLSTMWANGQDTNNDGIPVRLYQPILYSGRTVTRTSSDPTFSHIGGVPSDGGLTPQCSLCGENMPLLLQLHRIESSTTLFVFGCNRGSCVSSLFDVSRKFSLGGGGVFVCRHSGSSCLTNDSATKEDNAASSPWVSDDKGDAENDWDIDENEANLEDVEAMVAAMEMDGSTKAKQLKPKHSKKPRETSNAFPCFEVHGLQEPAMRRGDDMDDDDVGMTGGSDDKIQQMLARYMAEEEDEDILAAIRGSGGSGGGSGRGEKDERLPPEDRAMLAFTDRVKRVPRQVVRYAKGGIPLWSIPLPKENVQTGKSRRGKDQVPAEQAFVPNCSCGSPREFECQLMPSLLHVLDVDKRSKNGDAGIDELMRSGGMNWGVIAIYTCTASCNNRDDFVMVQDSVDGSPERRKGATDDSMVAAVDDDEMVDNDASDDDLDDDCEDNED